jgi:hypothetical protein
MRVAIDSLIEVISSVKLVKNQVLGFNQCHWFRTSGTGPETCSGFQKPVAGTGN